MSRCRNFRRCTRRVFPPSCARGGPVNPRKQYFTGDDGRTYQASFRSIGIACSSGLMLVALAPLDACLATVLKNRRYLIFLTLACVLAAIPVVFLLGSVLSRSIKTIAAETDRIQRFEPG